MGDEFLQEQFLSDLKTTYVAQKYDKGIHLKVYDKKDNKIINKENLSIEQVEELVGKNIANEIRLDIEKDPRSQSRGESNPDLLLKNSSTEQKNIYMKNFLKENGKDLGVKIKKKDNDFNMWFMNLTDSLKKQSIEAGMPIAFNKPVNPLFNYA